ncbi:plasmolipin [Lepeophtheirus salmonis]|uniref:Putative LOC408400 [Apis mellifera] n=1 Tax=Lepeophtheirus salmonis TaxID=72036 RepID=A0A0K2T403_LEPSM|nr:uncharacterized protein LOC121114808 [Lepeophtheirus salmonis]XP_040564823.1 uncharacterized protein LOC121114808 [Lepeophtheirus salmonis]
MSYPPPAEPINGNGAPPQGGYGYPPQTSSYPPSGASSGHHPTPPTHETSVRVSTDPTPGTHVTQIQLDIGYFKTIPGIIKIVELVLGVLCMILASPARTFGYIYSGNKYGIYLYGEGQNHWFLFVVVTSFIITLLWTFFYFLQLRESIKNNLPFSWLKLEYFYTLITTILYIIAFIVILEGFGYCPGATTCDTRIAAGSFAIFNSIAYGIGTFLLHQEYRSQQM